MIVVEGKGLVGLVQHKVLLRVLLLLENRNVKMSLCEEDDAICEVTWNVGRKVCV